MLSVICPLLTRLLDLEELKAEAESDTDGPVMELTAADRVDMQMRNLLAASLGENISGGSDDDLPDYYDIFDWDPNPSTVDYYALALRNPYAFAVTFLPASASWRDPPDIVDDTESDEDDGQTQFERDVEELTRDLDVNQYLKRSDKLSGIGDFGVLVLEYDDVQQGDVAGGDDDVDVDAFTKPVTNPRQLTGLKPFSRLSISSVELGGPGSGRWGEPVFYEIDLTDENDEEFDFRHMSDDTDVDQGGPDTLRVHHTRVIHGHSDELLDDEVRGIPRQQPVYNNLIDIEKTLGSAGELAYRASAWGIGINIDKDFDIDDGGDALREHLHRWEVGLENVLRVHGAESIESLGGEEITPSSIIDPNIEAICSLPYMPPQSILKGNETGERATTENRKEWDGQIQERREQYVSPTFVRAFWNRQIEHGIVSPPENGPNAYSVEWPPREEPSESDIAEMQNVRSETLERLRDLGLNRQQRVDYLRDGSLPTEIDDIEDDIAELEDAEAAGSSARSVEEMEAALADGGEVTDGD